jgi:hypothetical protein
VQTHLLHPIVLILGVLFALRRMDVSMRSAEQYPGVDVEAFGRWKRLAMGGYGLGMASCFGKVLLDFGFAYLFFRIYAPPTVARWTIGLTLDVGWVVLVVVSYLRVRRAHRLARELGVDHRPER